MTEVGDYRLMGKLGEGTFSEVLKVRNKRNAKYYAMKRFKKHFKSVDEIECLREIQALRRLNHHPNIIQLEEVIFDAKYGILSLTFELMDANLYEVLSKKGVPPIHEQRAKWVMWQVVKALDFAHSKGIFHRDIKPENILVRGDIHSVPIPFPSANPNSPYHAISSFPLVKLADFGSCRGIHSHLPYTEYIATRWYRSPECLLFDGIYSYKMDIWGIGCVFFELITKIPIFPGDDELDQLHKIHNVMGTPSERLLKVMVAACTQAVATSNSNSLEQKQVKRIFKRHYNFPPTKGCGLRAAFPPYILYGASRVPPKTAASLPGYNPNDYPGITDECVNLIELLLQYDPDARPSARQAMKHPWLKECRDAEAAEKHGLAVNTALTSPTQVTTSPTSNNAAQAASSPPPVAQQQQAADAQSPVKAANAQVTNNSNNNTTNTNSNTNNTLSPTKVAAPAASLNQAAAASSSSSSIDPSKTLIKKRTKNREKAPAIGGMEAAPAASAIPSSNIAAGNNLLFNDAAKKKAGAGSDQAAAQQQQAAKKIVNNTALASYAAATASSKYYDKVSAVASQLKAKETMGGSNAAARKFTFKKAVPSNNSQLSSSASSQSSQAQAASAKGGAANPLSILIPSKLPSIASAQSAHVTSNAGGHSAALQPSAGPTSAFSDPGQSTSPLQPHSSVAKAAQQQPDKVNLVEKAKHDASNNNTSNTGTVKRNSNAQKPGGQPQQQQAAAAAAEIVDMEIPQAPVNRPQTTKKLEPLELAPDANRPAPETKGDLGAVSAVAAADMTVESLRRRLSQQDLSKDHAQTSNGQSGNYKVVSNAAGKHSEEHSPSMAPKQQQQQQQATGDAHHPQQQPHQLAS